MADAQRAPILLVDDRPEDLLLLETLLSGLAVEVSKARTGREALARVEGEDFALVVLDVRLGDASGFDIARQLRGLPRGEALPLMFLTAVEFEDDKIVEAYTAGAVDYLFKPINPAIFRSKVSVFVELYLKNLRLQQLDLMKDQFLSVVSHELRTPLHFVIGAASILEDRIAGPMTTQQESCVKTIMTGADALLRLVNDLLDMSQIRAGRFSLNHDWIAVNDVVEQIFEQLSQLADTKRIALEFQVSDGLPSVWADPRRLVQVLLNLVDNAVKFTEPGGAVTVRARQEAEQVVWEVEDTGIGLPPDCEDQVFEPFWQGDMSSTREARGTGLGLAITKALVEAHGGTIGVRRKDGPGSVFWFSLDVSPESARLAC